MRLGIDASNLRSGGGLTHIFELLEAARPQEHGFAKVVVWASGDTLKKLPSRPWLQLVHEPMLDRSLPVRLYWQRVRLPMLARRNCDCLFVPGGSFGGNFKPVVTMSRNMLPFDSLERRRYGMSWMAVKMFLLKLSQSRSLRRADGVIFLTEYARLNVKRAAGLSGSQLVIPHGVNQRFFSPPKEQRPIESYSHEDPFRLLYVSKIEPYKHQWRVVEAVAELRRKGFPIALELIGETECATSARILKESIRRHDPDGRFICHSGGAPHAELPDRYRRADAFVFASSCENLPNILLEAMASGLPIASSNCGPMPEVLGAAGIYFHPEKHQQLKAAIQLLIEDHVLRQYLADKAYQQSQLFSWQRCADDTFAYLADIGICSQPVIIHQQIATETIAQQPGVK